MNEINASDYDQLAAAVDRLSKEELVAAIQSQEGGVDGTLDQVFQGMVDSFNAEKAAGQQAAVQYEITAPDGVHPYAMRIADGRCEVERGAAESPRVTLKIGLGDFLQLVTNRLPGMQAFMTGKLKVSGDLFYAQTFASWFTRPGS